ncbi:MAG: enoyl-CoA hydratase-related protein [Halobacteria archaeon]|nr:enoyl-CoA hydratase-related protein [Halobacteria archaeon]
MSTIRQANEEYENFVVEYFAHDDGTVAEITVSNPPVNALNSTALNELNGIVDEIEEEADAAVITGEGTTAFVAGADIEEFLEQDEADDVEAMCETAHTAFDKIESLDIPVVSAVNGVALGGGNELQMSTHYTVVDGDAEFGQPEINLYIIPGYGGTQRLPRLAYDENGDEGYKQAAYMILNGRNYSADEALEMGFVDEVVDKEAAVNRAHDLAYGYITGEDDTLEDAHSQRQSDRERWESGDDYPDLSDDAEYSRILTQSEEFGRTPAVEAAVEAIEEGFENGISDGLEAEGELFGEVVVDDDLGKTGIQDFLDGSSNPLPLKPHNPPLVPDEETKEELIEDGVVLPPDSPFYPGATPVPDYQLAWALTGDEETGEPDHGEPVEDGAEKEVVVPVEEPGPNDALLYMLTSEVNYNDVWAITGIPVSTYKNYDKDYHITGSGGLALVAETGQALKEEGRIEVGDLVHVYAGQFDVLSPNVGRDPMDAGFEIQGYQTPDGSHQQFMVAQGPQLFKPPQNLDLTEAGSYILTMGTIYRALFTNLDVEPDKNIFIEGASTGTGRDAVMMASSRGLNVTGLVSSDERAERAKGAGAHAAINRKQEALEDAMHMVPNDPDEWDDWVEAGQPLLDEYREKNDGDLADYVISHAGAHAFSRSYQLLDDGGRLAFYGASTGYEMAFIGKGGESTPEEMYRRADLRAGEGVMVWYGTPEDVEGVEDEVGEEAIEAAIDNDARVAVVTETDEQKEYVEDSYDVEGVVSLDEIDEESDRFEWLDTMPQLPGPSNPDELSAAIGDYMNKMFKPIGIAVGQILKTPDNPRGNPEVIFERAGQNTLSASTMMCSSYMGKVVFSEEMEGDRYSFYAPQVWMRQRRIYMPSTEIFGTHMKNQYEVKQMNSAIEQGIFEIPETHLTPWDEAPVAHQEMWDNVHEEGSYVINHALPEDGLETKEELLETWEEEWS